MRSTQALARIFLVVALMASVCAGCTVGPNYKPPTPPSPANGAFASALLPTVGSADQPPPNWWRLYNTPALDQLVQAALTHNNTLLAAAANLSEARAALSLARAGRFPTTTLSAGAQYGVTSDALLLNEIKGLGPPNPSGYFTAGLDVSYEVDLFGRIHRAVQAAAADYEAQKAAEDVSRISVAGETTRAYLNACALAQQKAVAEQSLSTVTQTYDVTAQEVKFGSASDFDLARAAQLVAQTRATLPGFESQRRAALFELAVLTGQPPEEISQAANACTTPPRLTTPFPIGDVQSLFKRRPDVRQAERQLAANVARIGVATANLYPTISIGASALSAANSLSGLGSLGALTYGIGPLLNWSFPNTLVAQAQVREARATASASLANFQGVVLQALQDTEEAVTTYGAELDRNAALATARNQSQTAYKLAQIQYQNGSASYLDLLTAESNLIDANAALASSDQMIASDQATLFKALGGGWEQAPDIKPPPIIDGRSGVAIPIR